MQQKEAQSLFRKYLQGTCSEEEKALLESWYLEHELRDLPEIPTETREQHLEEVWQSLPVHEAERPTIRLWTRIAVAAIMLVALSAGLYFYKTDSPPANQQAYSPIIPGSNRAILTLSDGSKVNLTDRANGEIAEKSGIAILKKADGELVYDVKNNARANPTAYNTIETPRGGQYQVILPDGTKVWLNASSSLKFPASFAARSERKVELKGEAFFEVQKDKSKPFRVVVENEQIEVLGTHFNVMAYADEEKTKTTLVEGSVRLKAGKNSAILKPGQQGFLSAGGSGYNISKADISTITAWKDGMFVFNRTDLRSLMRQISRWYDVDVQYEQGVKDDVFYGKISRKADLKKVLKILELGDVKFKTEGRKLTVLK